MRYKDQAVKYIKAMYFEYEHILPHFVKLVSIGWIRSLWTLVISIQAAEQSLWIEQLSGWQKTGNKESIILVSVSQTQECASMIFHVWQTALMQVLPSTDGSGQVCSCRHLGLHSHNVQVHQVVEEEMQNTAIYNSETARWLHGTDGVHGTVTML